MKIHNIPIADFVRERLCIPRATEIRRMHKRDRDRYYTELGNAIVLVGWLKEKRYLRKGVWP